MAAELPHHARPEQPEAKLHPTERPLGQAIQGMMWWPAWMRPVWWVGSKVPRPVPTFQWLASGSGRPSGPFGGSGAGTGARPYGTRVGTSRRGCRGRPPRLPSLPRGAGRPGSTRGSLRKGGQSSPRGGTPRLQARSQALPLGRIYCVHRVRSDRWGNRTSVVGQNRGWVAGERAGRPAAAGRPCGKGRPARWPLPSRRLRRT